MQNTNVALSTSNADAILLDSVTSLDISRGVVYKKLPQAPQQFTDMIVEIVYIHQGFLPN